MKLYLTNSHFIEVIEHDKKLYDKKLVEELALKEEEFAIFDTLKSFLNFKKDFFYKYKNIIPPFEKWYTVEFGFVSEDGTMFTNENENMYFALLDSAEEEVDNYLSKNYDQNYYCAIYDNFNSERIEYYTEISKKYLGEFTEDDDSYLEHLSSREYLKS